MKQDLKTTLLVYETIKALEESIDQNVFQEKMNELREHFLIIKENNDYILNTIDKIEFEYLEKVVEYLYSDIEDRAVNENAKIYDIIKQLDKILFKYAKPIK